jgi:hypothetical protein
LSYEWSFLIIYFYSYQLYCYGLHINIHFVTFESHKPLLILWSILLAMVAHKHLRSPPCKSVLISMQVSCCSQAFQAELSAVKTASLNKIKEVMRSSQLQAPSQTAPPPTLPVHASDVSYLNPQIHLGIMAASPDVTITSNIHPNGNVAGHALSGAAVSGAIMGEAVYDSGPSKLSQQLQQPLGSQGPGYPPNGQQYSLSKVSQQPPVTLTSIAPVGTFPANNSRSGEAMTSTSTHSDWML